MAVQGVRSSRAFRAFVLTTVAGSLLAWLYTVARIVINGIDPPDPFFPGVRGVSFLEVGGLSFFLFCASLFLYLWLWGRFDARSAFPRGWDGREP